MKKDKIGGIKRFKWWMHRWLDFPEKPSEEEINSLLGQEGTIRPPSPPINELISENEVRRSNKKK